MAEKKAPSQKVLQRMSKNSAKGGKKTAKGDDFSGNMKNLKNQYDVIRSDVLKLRDDLQKGYDMARNMVDRKSLIKDFLKAK